jgi:hypothetical protein
MTVGKTTNGNSLNYIQCIGTKLAGDMYNQTIHTYTKFQRLNISKVMSRYETPVINKQYTITITVRDKLQNTNNSQNNPHNETK